MASTAAGVAVGSTMGHGLSNMLFGSSAPAEAQQDAPPAAGQWNDGQQSSTGSMSCEVQSKGRCAKGIVATLGLVS
jgi:hypothetical protein